MKTLIIQAITNFVYAIITGAIVFWISGEVSLAAMWAIGVFVLAIIFTQLSLWAGAKIYNTSISKYLKICDEYWK